MRSRTRPSRGAALRSLGSDGLGELVERNCRLAARMAERLSQQKGVKIRLILDKNQARNSPVVTFLREEGFEMRITAGRPGGKGMGVMHNKFGRLIQWQVLLLSSIFPTPIINGTT